MNNRVISMSLIMAVLAVLFIDNYVSSIEDKAKKEFGTEVLVVSAATDIQEMMTIDETMLELKTIPKKFLEPASISFVADGESGADRARQDMKSLMGAVAIVSLKKGEQITYNKITEPSLRTGLAPQVTPGKRAIAIPVDEISGVGKLLKPGDRVDVIITVDGGSRESKFTKTLYQDLVVLAVGRNITNNVARLIEKDPNSKVGKIRSLASDDRFSSVTLEVDPSQAQTIAMVMATGRDAILFALRNNDDTERTNIPGVTLWDALGPDAAKVRAILNERKQGGRTIPFGN